MVEHAKRPDLLTQRMATLGVYDSSSKWQEAIGLSTVILKQLSRRKESPEILAQIADVLNTRGKALRCNVQQHQAIPCFEKALSITEKLGDQERRLITLGNLIDGWRTHPRDEDATYPSEVQTKEQKKAYALQQAGRFADQAQTLINQMPPEFSEARGHVWNQFGLLYTEPEATDHKKALAAYIPAETGFRKALETNPKHQGLQERLARTIHLKGVALENLGQLPEAETAQREALDRSLQLEHAQNIGNAANGLSDVLIKLGRPSEALPYIKLAIKVSEKDGQVIHPEIHRDAMRRLAQFQNPSN